MQGRSGVLVIKNRQPDGQRFIRLFFCARGRLSPKVKPAQRLLLVAAALLASSSSAATQSPSPQALEAGSFLRADDYRVARVAYRLATAGKQHCGPLLPLTGMFLHYLPEYEGPNRAEAVKLYGVDRGPGVLSVVGASPAARAGLAAGDVLLAINDIPLPTGDALARAGSITKWRTAAAGVQTLVEEQLRIGPARLKLLREGRPLTLMLHPEMGCPIRARLARSNQANAFADGRTVIMTTRLLDFVRSDDELAVVLGHEAAHNILAHPARLEAEKVPKGFLANFGKNAGRLRATEEEADRLGLKLTWAAGYDVSAAIPFWRRLYRTYDPIPTPKLFNRHPSLAARERAVAETIAGLSRSAQPQPR